MFQKKVEVQAPIELSDADIKKIKDKLSEKEIANLKITDLNIPDIIPQVFNGTLVDIQNGHHVLYLADRIDGSKYKTFRKTNGGVFSRDVLAFKRNLDHGNYVLIEGKGERKIVRLIEDDELFLFQTFKLVNGIIKDKAFMTVRELQPDEKLAYNGGYIEKNSGRHEPEEVMLVDPLVIDVEDDHETNVSSVSLFDE